MLGIIIGSILISLAIYVGLKQIASAIKNPVENKMKIPPGEVQFIEPINLEKEWLQAKSLKDILKDEENISR